MQLQTVIPQTGVPKASKASARRAITAILKRSVGAIPQKDLHAVLAIVTAAITTGTEAKVSNV